MKAISLSLLLVSAFLLAACFDFGQKGGQKADRTPTPSPEATAQGGPSNTPEDAIGDYGRDQLQQEYVGDCGAAKLPDDSGKLCTVFKGEREGLRAYVAGLAFSEFFTWLFVGQQEGQWRVVAQFDIHEEAADVPGIPWPLTEGAEVLVTATGQCLNVREGPGLKANAVDCIKDGTKIKVAQGPLEADGFQWWRVEGRAGWIAADWLRYPDAVEPAAGPTPGR